MRSTLLLFIFGVLAVCIANSQSSCSFAYIGDTGPMNWGTICNNEYPLCSSGLEQSPIDIIPHSTEFNITGNRTAIDGEDLLIPLSVVYEDAVNATIQSNGHTMMIFPPNGTKNFGRISGHPIFDGILGAFDFTHASLHSTSEHMIYGIDFELELQLWHYSPSNNGSYIVLVYLFVPGAENALLAPIVSAVYNFTNSTKGFNTTASIAWNSKLSVFPEAPYYYYRGSMTTPPCTENVHWFIFSDFQGISPVQANVMLQALGNNFRPLQKVGSRTVYQYDPTRYTASLGEDSSTSSLALFTLW